MTALRMAMSGPEFWSMVVVWLATVTYCCVLIVRDR